MHSKTNVDLGLALGGFDLDLGEFSFEKRNNIHIYKSYQNQLVKHILYRVRSLLFHIINRCAI